MTALMLTGLGALLGLVGAAAPIVAEVVVNKRAETARWPWAWLVLLLVIAAATVSLWAYLWGRVVLATGLFDPDGLVYRTIARYLDTIDGLVDAGTEAVT